MGIFPCGSWERLLPTALRAVRSDAGLRAGVPSPDTTYLYPNRHSNWGRIDMCMFVSVYVCVCVCLVSLRILGNCQNALQVAIVISVAIIIAIPNSFHTWKKLQLVECEVSITLTQF